MNPNSLLNACKAAAKKPSYGQALDMLERNLDSEFWDVAKATLPFYVCGHVLDLSTAAERREYMETIPASVYPTNAKSLIEMGVRKLYADLQR